MAALITYYAIVDEYSSREHPAGVLRRVRDDEGQEDQVFGRELRWEFTPLLYSYERGDGDNELYEIPGDEAAEIVARISRGGLALLPAGQDALLGFLVVVVRDADR